MAIPKLLQTSEGTGDLSLTVKGILVAIIPIVIAVTPLNEVEGNAIIEVIVTIVNLSTMLIASVAGAFGLYRKIKNRLQS